MTAFPARFRRLLEEILRRTPRREDSSTATRQRRRRARSESGTFSGHRGYSPGDDLRHVDWSAYARSDELHVKVWDEEDRRDLVVLLDRSASMQAPVERWLGALRMTAILGGRALVTQQRLRVMSGAVQLELQGAAAISQLLNGLGELQANEDRELPERVLQGALERARPHAVLWVSDFADPQKASPVLRRLRLGGLRVVGFVPELQADREPPQLGLVRLQDPETGQSEVIEIDRVLQTAMRQEMRQLARSQRAAFVENGCQLRRLRLPDAEDFRMTRWRAPSEGGRAGEAWWSWS